MWRYSIRGSLNVRSCRDSGTPWQKVNGVGGVGGEEEAVQAEESPGGKACWEGSMAHLTPACPLLNQAGPLTPFTHSLPGNEVVQLLEMSVHSQMQPLVVICWCITGKGLVTKWGKLSLHSPVLTLCVSQIVISSLEVSFMAYSRRLKWKKQKTAKRGVAQLKGNLSGVISFHFSHPSSTLSRKPMPCEV